ncbi:DUF2938 domain-containing protein [Ramlibacter sp. USB13]|uniref:DUF2938 domain-containing protein n=1 Tax=Ramlibacter cellulosilyticus TaxID=2764187 RepID=A0A923MNI2_9BURK|nr:DUF2938 domain-containing protein [Ramlibacter cellulosilyticus]MBC5781324.1 DUF2938 domain-containing protein [Ramlibacter cellulosilyticus]
MNPIAEDLTRTVLLGLMATAVMDLWLLLLERLGIPTLDFALIGRWVGHLARGRIAHASIARAEPVAGERALGWITHYLTGVAFAAVLVAVQGTGFTRDPSLLPALAVGIATVAAPWFVMQPAMGAGIAASRTPTPWKNRLRSLANHTVFGGGLYLAAAGIAWISR